MRCHVGEPPRAKLEHGGCCGEPGASAPRAGRVVLDRLVATALRFRLSLATHLSALAVRSLPGGEVAIVCLIEVDAACAVSTLAADRRGAVRTGGALRHRTPWHGLSVALARATARATLYEQLRTPANDLGHLPWSTSRGGTSTVRRETHQRNGRS